MEVVGYIESVDLPEIELFQLDAKIDTGADSCSIHCDDIKIEGIDLINNELNTYKKKSRWNVNFGIGMGLYPNNGTVTPAPFVGVVLGYSPKWLQF